MDNIVRFLRGNYAKYDSETMADGIYFAQDKQILILNGVEYGGFDEVTFNGIIKDVSVNGKILTYKRYISGKWSDITITLLDTADTSIEFATIPSTGDTTNGTSIKLKAIYDSNADGDGLRLTKDGVKVVLDKTRGRLAIIEGDENIDGSIKQSLKAAKEYTDTLIGNETSRAKAAEQANADALLILNGDVTVEGSVQNIIDKYMSTFEVDGGNY